MSGSFAVRPMRPGELELVLEWARQEGWNPGLDDSIAFHAADPTGFFIGAVGEVPVGSISVVKYGESLAFVGLYLVHPDYRGRGHGKALWDAGLASAGSRSLGLDGVVAQQENYRRQGFELAYVTHRYQGLPKGLPEVEAVATPVGAKLDGVLRYDAAVFGAPRPDFLAAWCGSYKGRRTAVFRKGGKVRGYGTIRRCHVGYKIGPLFAADRAAAEAVLAGLLPEADGQSVAIDVPAVNGAGVDLALSLGLDPVFETARMYRGPAPSIPVKQVFGVTSLELG